jgi:ribosomal protein S12 methylthiotransferase
MALQAEISAERLEAKIGSSIEVLVDGYDADGNAIARSSADAPEIDGTVIVDSHSEIKTGEFYKVRVTGAGDYDLFAELD